MAAFGYGGAYTPQMGGGYQGTPGSAAAYQALQKTPFINPEDALGERYQIDTPTTQLQAGWLGSGGDADKIRNLGGGTTQYWGAKFQGKNPLAMTPEEQRKNEFYFQLDNPGLSPFVQQGQNSYADPTTGLQTNFQAASGTAALRDIDRLLGSSTPSGPGGPQMGTMQVGGPQPFPTNPDVLPGSRQLGVDDVIKNFQTYMSAYNELDKRGIRPQLALQYQNAGDAGRAGVYSQAYRDAAVKGYENYMQAVKPRFVQEGSLTFSSGRQL